MVEPSPVPHDRGRLLTFTLVICLCSCSGSTATATASISHKRSLLSNELIHKTPRDTTSGPWLLIQDKYMVLSMINKVRRGIKDAADMTYLDWSSCLEKFAAYRANNCNASDAKKLPDFKDFESRSLITFALPTLNETKSNALFTWYKTKPKKIGELCTEGDHCEQFNKMIWAKSRAVGCAMKACKPLTGYSGVGNGQLMLCLIGPVANNTGLPYKKGKTCSRCPKSHRVCYRRLCATKGQREQGMGKAAPINHTGASILVTMVTVLATTAVHCQLPF